MATYIHELPDWPRLIWASGRLTSALASARHAQGVLSGRMEALGFPARDDAIVETFTSDVLKTSEIEGEKFDPAQVRSSVARRLGIDIGALKPSDRHVDGVVDMTLDATQRYDADLTEDRLFAWHTALFPTGRAGAHPVTVGAWRDDSTAPMQVVSGPVGRERVHFEAPPAARLADEMRQFLAWFNDDVTTEPVLKAAQAHLWFVTIHPFDDGNGRIARAISDMVLARSEGSSRRFYSMSAQIRQERGDYYRVLEETQRATLDITPWMQWFLGCLTRAIENARTALAGVIAKGRHWEQLRDVPLNDRQRLMINRLLDGFEGKLTTSKWAALTKTSLDTALRDIRELVDHGVLVRNPEGGRSTSYSLAMR